MSFLHEGTQFRVVNKVTNFGFTSDLLDCPEVLQFALIHGWDLVVSVPATANQNNINIKTHGFCKAR